MQHPPPSKELEVIIERTPVLPVYLKDLFKAKLHNRTFSEYWVSKIGAVIDFLEKEVNEHEKS